MNLTDVIIILLFITALFRGIELGVVRQLCATVGLIAGLFIGIFIQAKIIGLMHSPLSKAALSLIVILITVNVFSQLGAYAGGFIRSRIERARRLKLLDVTDRGLGSLVAGATVLLIVWLTAGILTSIPVQVVQRQVSNSFIVAQLNKSLPPTPSIVAKLGHLIDPNSFPQVFTGLEPRIDTSAPLPSIGELDSAVSKARLSVVKIEGEGCGGVSQGSGFVAADNLVITNAHVVAGVARPTILDGSGRHKAQVIWFDSALDMAVLKAEGLAGEPLALNPTLASTGTPGAVVGYPGGGDFTARPATVLDSFTAIGRDIYNQGETKRTVYSLKAAIEPGNSGGPLINAQGEVIGLIFAESTTYDDVGYALTMERVMQGLQAAQDSMQPVGTGSCRH